MKTTRVTSDQIRKLITIGAVNIPALTEKEVEILLSEAAQYSFKERQQLTETGVHQDFFGYDSFKPGSAFMKLAVEGAAWLNRVFGKMVPAPIVFNDFSLQLYPVRERQTYAISPHRDHKNCVNLIAVYLLRGKAPFCICTDRAGAHAIEIGSKSGDLILMRGTGFLNSSTRPFHYVGKIVEERLTFGMRQTVDRKELPKYYEQTQ